MKQPGKEAVIEFVKNVYGNECANTLKNIHTGGTNNQKGRDYENFYQLYKVFEIAANDSYDHENQFIAAQLIGFVDDICHIDYENKRKYNYQAKNTLGATANWTDDTSKRFRMQRKIDSECFHIEMTTNYLLVSSKTKAKQNIELIPEDLKDQDKSIYFPYPSNLLELFLKTDISKYIESLTGKKDAGTSNYAASLVLGILQAGTYTTVNNILSQAQCIGHPNPFRKFFSRNAVTNLPPWLAQKLTDFSDTIKYEVEYGTLYLTVNDCFKIECVISLLANASEDTIKRINSAKALVSFLMTETGRDIGTPLAKPER